MKQKSAGFSMLEILIALVISLVTLMGAAGLVVRTVQQEVEAVQRLQALTLVQDMVERINVNRLVAACYSNAANGITVGTGANKAGLPDCTAGTANQNDRAEADIDEWHDLLTGISVQNAATTNIGAMIDARGCITQENAATNTYRVSVAWQGLSDTTEPTNTCGDGLYSTDESRRTVSMLVRIGDLGA
jgi:type IV pilus assembly protein PilV